MSRVDFFRAEDIREARIGGEAPQWLIPGGIPVRGTIILTGSEREGRKLLLEELLVSASTFTPLMGAAQPWALTRVLYCTSTPDLTARQILHLVGGRRLERSPDELQIVPGGFLLDREEDQGALLRAIDQAKPRVVAFDALSAFLSAPGVQAAARDFVDRLVGRDLAIVLGDDFKSGPLNADYWFSSAKTVLYAGFNAATLQYSIFNAERVVARAAARVLGDALSWSPKPPVDISAVEARIYSLIRARPATSRELRRVAGAHHWTIYHALKRLKSLGLAVDEKKPVIRAGRGYSLHYVWRGIDPYLDVRTY